MMLSSLKGLNAFRAVMEAGSLTDAARRLNVTQPAVSRLVANLEDATGLTLFRRERQRLVPTPEAEVFYREAVRVLAAWEQIPRLARDIKAQHGVRLRIVTVPRLATGILPDVLKNFSKTHPDAQLTVDVLSRRDCEKSAPYEQFDIGLVPIDINHPALRKIPIFNIRGVICVSKGHRLAGRETVEVSDLLDEEFVVPAQGNVVREQLDRLFMQVGRSPIIRMETSSIIFAARLAAHGFGACFCDPLTAQWCGGDNVSLIEISPPFVVGFGAIYHAGRMPSAPMMDFIETVRETVPAILDKTGFRYRMIEGNEQNYATG
jgi:DNA-binding transcriptional LysR family regulator